MLVFTQRVFVDEPVIVWLPPVEYIIAWNGKRRERVLDDEPRDAERNEENDDDGQPAHASSVTK